MTYTVYNPTIGELAPVLQLRGRIASRIITTNAFWRRKQRVYSVCAPASRLTDRIAEPGSVKCISGYHYCVLVAQVTTQVAWIVLEYGRTRVSTVSLVVLTLVTGITLKLDAYM